METQINQRRGLLILLFFTFFMVVGFDMIMPLVIGHYVNNVGLTATAVSVALAIRQFSQQGLAMIGGALADRFQVKTLISVGVFLRVLGFLTLAFSSAYGMLIAAMILIGLGGVLFEMPYQSAIAMLTTNDNRPKYYSLNNTITGIIYFLSGSSIHILKNIKHIIPYSPIENDKSETIGEMIWYTQYP